MKLSRSTTRRRAAVKSRNSTTRRRSAHRRATQLFNRSAALRRGPSRRGPSRRGPSRRGPSRRGPSRRGPGYTTGALRGGKHHPQNGSSTLANVGLGLGAVAAVGATAAFVVDQQHKKREAEAAQARAEAEAAKAQAEVNAASPRLHALFEDLKNFETQFKSDADKGKYSAQIFKMREYNTRLQTLKLKLADEIKNTKDAIQSQQELRDLMNEVSNYLRVNTFEFESQDPRIEKYKALLANIGYYGSLGLFSIGGRFAVKALFDVFGLPGSWVPESVMM